MDTTVPASVSKSSNFIYILLGLVIVSLCGVAIYFGYSKETKETPQKPAENIESTKTNSQILLEKADNADTYYGKAAGYFVTGTKLYSGHSWYLTRGYLELLTVETDGNITLKSLDDAEPKIMWQSNTSGKKTSYITLLPDNNVVAYDTAGAIVWQSNTAGQGAPGTTGNVSMLVASLNNGPSVYDNTGKLIQSQATVGGTPAASGTSGTGDNATSTPASTMMLQSTLNYTSNADFTSGTKLTAGQSWKFGTAVLIVQSDGNVVLYDCSDATSNAPGVLWNTNTAGQPTNTFILQNDNNIVVYDINGNALWTAHLAGQGAMPSLSSSSKLVVRNGGIQVLDSAGNYFSPS